MVFAAWLCVGWRNAGADAEGAEGMRGRTQRARREYGNERRRRRSYAEYAKGNTKFVWERLEAVFMRVAGHKWLGRRMEAACRCFCGFALRRLEEYGNERRSYAEGAKGIPNYFKRQANSIRPSFPRRRESMSAFFMPLDSRLRGNDDFLSFRSSLLYEE